jgi:pimeloyl-[acyl-carrier protein] methyl ester esterase
LLAALGEFADELDVRVLSYPTSGALGYQELAEIAAASLPDSPYVILGESFSGPIAICLAAGRPQHLQGLILCCTFISNPRPSLALLRRFVGLLPISDAFIPLASVLLLGRFSSRALRAALSEAIRQVSAASLKARLAAVLVVDVTAEFLRVQVPVLYMRASSDRLVPRSASGRVVRLKPSTAVAEFDAPHLLLQVAPEQAAQAIAAFVRSLPAAKAQQNR